MKISRVKIKNYRNLQNVDVNLNDVVAIIGENNSGKSNFLRAITLPFLADEWGYYGKNLSWIDINETARDEYYKFIIDRQSDIISGLINLNDFINNLPKVSVEVELKPHNVRDEYFLKELSYDIDQGEMKYALLFEFSSSKPKEIYNLVKSILAESQITKETINNVKMNLLPTDYYAYSISVPNKGSVSYDVLKNFKYVPLEAERDEFSRTKDKIGSKSLIKLLQHKLTDNDKLKVEKEYNHFFEELKSISGMNKILNWQEESELEEAKDFFEHISILPNMPPMQSILNSVRLGYSDEELSLQGLGYRNLILMLVLINSYIDKKEDIALNILTIEEPEAHLCINNERLMVSFIKAFTSNNPSIQLFYSTHSTEFINKMNLKNVIILHDGKAFSLKDELSEDSMDYLTKNPNLDLFKLFFSRKCILFEGISEEMLLRSYLNSKNELNDIELISFHKGYEEIIKIWKKVNWGTKNKLGIIRDYDDQPKAQQNHDQYNDDVTICVRTTSHYTLEPEIVYTGDNYKVLKEQYGELFGWKNMTKEEMQEAWCQAKSSNMLIICKDMEMGELKGFEMPKHIHEVLEFMKMTV